MRMIKSKLAIFGGPKTVTKPSPHFPWPIISKMVENAVRSQLYKSVSIYNRSGVIKDFEDRFAEYHQKKYGLLTSSGTAAIHSMFAAADLRPGDEVICPAYTFYATVTPLFFTGAIPVLADADSTGNIDPNMIEKLITKKTRAVIVTHMWGFPCQMDKILAICKKHKLRLFEDCSHAIGAKYLGKLAGTWGDAAAWSLQGQKIITGGEGGIIVTDNEELYYRALLLGHYNKRCKQEIPPGHPLFRFAVTGMGLKLRSHPLAVAIAREQFNHLDGWLAQKKIFAGLMAKRLVKLPGVKPPVVPKGADPAWYAFVFQYNEKELNNLSINKFFEAIKAEGCEEADQPGSTCPLNILPLFQNPSELFPNYKNQLSYKLGDFPMAEMFFNHAIKLPVWTAKKDEELVIQYLDAIEKVVKHHRDLL